MEWKPIETAPNEEHVPHVRGMWVYNAHTGKPLYFDMCAGYLEGGDFVSVSGDDFGWSPEDYTHWMPLPEPPKEDV